MASNQYYGATLKKCSAGRKRIILPPVIYGGIQITVGVGQLASVLPHISLMASPSHRVRAVG